MSTSRNKRSSQSFSLRTCILLSVLLHLILLCLSCEQNKVEAMSGSIGMVIVSGAGKAGQNASPAKAPAGPAKPEPSARQQEQKPAPAATPPEPVVRPKPKPTPVVQKKSIVPPKPKSRPAVRPVPVVKAENKPRHVVKPKKVVKKKRVEKKRVKRITRKKKRRARKAEAKKVKPAKQVKATPAKKADKHVAKTAQVSASRGERANPKATTGAGQENNDRQASAGGKAHSGPIHARIGSLHGPKITRWMRPRYPRKARAMGQTGLVVLRITIDAHGRPARVEVVRKAGEGFDEAAVTAVKRSSFTPATHKGHPVACIALLPVRFNLKGN